MSEKYKKTLQLGFQDMIENNNNNIFSYRRLKDVNLRHIIPKSIELNNEYLTPEVANKINDLDVLMLDDTVTTGKTISDSAQILTETFSPKSITFLTIFSPRVKY